MGVGFWQNSTHSIHSKVWTFKLRAAPRWPLRDHQQIELANIRTRAKAKTWTKWKRKVSEFWAGSKHLHRHFKITPYRPSLPTDLHVWVSWIWCAGVRRQGPNSPGQIHTSSPVDYFFLLGHFRHFRKYRSISDNSRYPFRRIKTRIMWNSNYEKNEHNEQNEHNKQQGS